MLQSTKPITERNHNSLFKSWRSTTNAFPMLPMLLCFSRFKWVKAFAKSGLGTLMANDWVAKWCTRAKNKQGKRVCYENRSLLLLLLLLLLLHLAKSLWSHVHLVKMTASPAESVPRVKGRESSSITHLASASVQAIWSESSALSRLSDKEARCTDESSVIQATIELKS